MKTRLKLRITDLFGGDGEERPMEVEKPVYTVQTVKSLEKNENVLLDSTQEITTKKVIERVNTFRRDSNDKPLQRLGGSHGKLWGSMKGLGRVLAEGKDNPTFMKYGIKSMSAVERMMSTVMITPVYPDMNIIQGYRVEKIPQILNTIGNSMITLYYDVIGEVEVEVILSYPERYHDVIQVILKEHETYPTLNKRRSIITVVEKEIIKDPIVEE